MSIKSLPVIKTLVASIALHVVDAVKKTQISSNTMAMEAPSFTTMDVTIEPNASKTLTNLKFLYINTWSDYDLAISTDLATVRFTVTSTLIMRAIIPTVVIHNTGTDAIRLEIVTA